MSSLLLENARLSELTVYHYSRGSLMSEAMQNLEASLIRNKEHLAKSSGTSVMFSLTGPVGIGPVKRMIEVI